MTDGTTEPAGELEDRAVELNQIERSFEEGMSQRRGDLPDILYHYTTPGGLLGIINSTSVWATHVGYLNDATELQYSYDLATVVLSESAKFPRSLKAGIIALRSLAFLAAHARTADVYVACFCSKSDLLSQWRAYATSGGGCCLGFDAIAMRDDLSASAISDFSLDKVCYDPDEHRRTIEALYGEVATWVENRTIGMERAELDVAVGQAALTLVRCLTRCAATFKHPAFSEEQEWRLVAWRAPALNPDEVQLRATDRAIVPYITLDMMCAREPYEEKLPLRQLVYGPTQLPAQARKSLEFIKLKRGFSNVEVLGSEAPLRA